MTYYPDLSPYQYLEGADSQSLNIGWLDGSMPYPTGTTSDEFRERLLEYCFSDNTVQLTRGFHVCNLDNCTCSLPPPPEHRGERVAYFGGSEIRVIGKSAIYAAPTLVYHYVVAHSYKPPDEFIEAVLAGPSPSSNEHQALRRKMKEQEESYLASLREKTVKQSTKK